MAAVFGAVPMASTDGHGRHVASWSSGGGPSARARHAAANGDLVAHWPQVDDGRPVEARAVGAVGELEEPEQG